MAFTSKSGTIQYEVRDGIAYVTLNRPAAQNALNGQMQIELSEVWPEINEDTNVKAVILTGKGENFCGWAGPEEVELKDGRQDWIGGHAHKDYEALKKAGIGPVPEASGLHHLGLPDRTRGRPAKPLIAAVNGACAGQGLAFIYFADIVICAQNAQFFDPRVSVSETPLEEVMGLIHLNSVPRIVGLRMAYAGGRFKVGADQAFQVGMATEVVADDKLLARATELAKQMADASPAAIQALVAGYWDTVDMPYGQARFIAKLFGQQARQMDGQEGHTALLEGRKPSWPSDKEWGLPWPAVRLPVKE